MSLASAAFRDASADAPDRLPFPDVVETFGAMGFRRLGRLERVVEGGIEGAAAAFAPEHRATFLHHKSVPTVVMAADDDSALVIIDWWWGMPELRIRSEMVDGSVVETRRRWDQDVVLPQLLERARRKLDVLEEQTISAVPARGRSIAAVSGDPAQLWDTHRANIQRWAARRATHPVPLDSMDAVVALSSRLAVHDVAVLRRSQDVARAVVLTLVGAPLLVLVLSWSGVLPTRMPVMVGLPILALFLALSSIVLRRMFRLRYVRWLRPRLRGPDEEVARRPPIATCAVAGLLVGAGALTFTIDRATAGPGYEFRYTQPGSEAPIGWNPCQPVEYAVYSPGAPRGADRIVRSAIRAISDATGLRFTYVGRADELLAADPSAPDERLLVGWATPRDVSALRGRPVGMGGSTYAWNAERKEFVYVRGAVFLDAPALRRTLREEGPAYVRAVVLHELAHAIGLGHVGDPDQLMDEDNLGQTELGAGDRAGLRALGSSRCTG